MHRLLLRYSGFSAASRRRSSLSQIFGLLVVCVLCVVAPYEFKTWLPGLMLVLAYAVGVAGFNLLYSAGQLSLGHAAFMSLGGFAYAFLAGSSTSRLIGLNLPPVAALVFALIIVGLAGIAFSPLTSRIGGLALAAATLGLVMLTDHIFGVVEPFAGGASGRPVPPFSFADVSLKSKPLVWYMIVAFSVPVFAYIRFLSRSRIGRALAAVREGELFAPALGIDVQNVKAKAFFVSSIIAGLSGILLGFALTMQVSESYSLTMSLNILMMSILGGVASPVLGALLGSAVFVLLPAVLRRFTWLIPGLSSEGSGGILTPATASSYIFALCIVAILVLQPRGLSGVVEKLITLVGRTGYKKSLNR